MDAIEGVVKIMSQRSSAVARPTKNCMECGRAFFRRTGLSTSQWEAMSFCSQVCAIKNRCETHGMRKTRLYRVWADIKTRCCNKNSRLFRHYGGRGITLYSGWMDDFSAFAAYVGKDPGKGFDVGRIDNDRGYEPGNIRWETEKQNCRNRRNTIWITVNGNEVSLAEAAEKSGVPYKKAWSRFNKGFSIDRVLQP